MERKRNWKFRVSQVASETIYLKLTCLWALDRQIRVSGKESVYTADCDPE